MLMVSRNDTESILIRPGDDIDPKMTSADLGQIYKFPVVRGLHHFYRQRAA